MFSIACLAQRHYQVLCPDIFGNVNFFKGGGTLSPILKFLGRTLVSW